MENELDSKRTENAAAMQGITATTTITTREATLSDAVPITRLLRQLGYELTQASVHEKLQALLSSPADKILVAISDDEIIGSISLHALPLLHISGALGRITSMVVDERYRGTGAGSTLIAAAEKWFSQAGCVKLEVTSGDQRARAHHFYEKHGFARDGQRLSKSVPPQ